MVQWPLKVGSASRGRHPYAGGLDEMLMDCLSKMREELEWGPAPMEAAAPVQLQVQSKEALLKPGTGKQGNILLPAPEGLERGQTATWTWHWEIKALRMRWVALVSLGQGVQINLQTVPWVIGTWPPVLKVTYPGPAGHEILLHGTFVISSWPITSSPASVSNWTWLQHQWNSAQSLWNAT